MKKLLLALVVLVGACTSAPPRSVPPPVIDGTTAETYPRQVPAEEVPRERIEAPRTNTSTSGAVVALLDRADDYQRSGDTGNEAATVERALRIDPKNPRLWSRLAAIRLDQQQPEQAEQLALKSNALAAGDTRLRGQNWSLIAEARRAMGDTSGARAAEREAAALR